MNYRKMIEGAKAKGLATNEKMWLSIEAVEELLDEIEDDDVYWKFLYRQHEIMYGYHYDEEFAEHDVDGISYIDRNGTHKTGAHWTIAEVESATRNYAFGNSVTKYDKFVAFNAFYADTCKVLTDEQILATAHAFFFADEDWGCPDCKIWQYMRAKCYYVNK